MVHSYRVFCLEYGIRWTLLAIHIIFIARRVFHLATISIIHI